MEGGVMFFSHLISSIKESDKVLEIGPGGTPHERADEFLDIDPELLTLDNEEAMQRGNAPRLITAKKITYYDGKAFPFEDNQFDYIIASHVLEHVDDVGLFVNELQRVAPMGYIEFPTIAYEYLYNFSVHLSFIHYDEDENTIYYMRKKDSNLNDYLPIQTFLLESLANGYSQVVDNAQDIMFEGFEWSRSSPLRVVQTNNLAKVMPEFHPIKPWSSLTLPESSDNTDLTGVNTVKNKGFTTQLARRIKNSLRRLIK